MADVEHKDIQDPQLHEPKGVVSANPGDVYVADGISSGAWEAPGPGLIQSGSAVEGELIVADGLGGAVWERSVRTDHGEMTIVNNSVATVVTAAGDVTLNTDADYTKIVAGWGNAHVHGVTFSIDKLVCAVDGHYEVSFWSSIKVPLNNNFIGIKYSVDDGTPYSLQKLVSQSVTTNDYKSIAGHGGIDLLAGQSISVYLAATKADSIVLEEAGLSLHLLHT